MKTPLTPSTAPRRDTNAIQKIFSAWRLAPGAAVLIAFFLIACSQAPIACTMDAMICPDGSAVGREGPNCEFAACPQLQSCGINQPCTEGQGCYILPESGNAYCYDETAVCMLACNTPDCAILESYPMQVRCS